MAEMIRQYALFLQAPTGKSYVISVYGEARADGIWEGWIEFDPVDGSGPVLETDRETSQPNKAALEYWASGLEPVYFEGAFSRAVRQLERTAH
jgi:hypothetical protein